MTSELLLLATLLFVYLLQKRVLTIEVHYKPSSWTIDASPPTTWQARIYLDPATIQTDSLMLETLKPTSVETATTYVGVTAYFNGLDFARLLLQKIGEATPGSYQVSVVLSGRLRNNTCIRGVNSITVIIPEPSPP